MLYTQANIHQRINAKNNAPVLYTGYVKGFVLTRIKMRDTDIFNGSRLMLRPDQFKSL